MADTLNLSLWFPGFDAELMLPRTGGSVAALPFFREPQRRAICFGATSGLGRAYFV